LRNRTEHLHTCSGTHRRLKSLPPPSHLNTLTGSDTPDRCKDPKTKKEKLPIKENKNKTAAIMNIQSNKQTKEKQRRKNTVYVYITM
jgi:hypothetical protein